MGDKHLSFVAAAGTSSLNNVGSSGQACLILITAIAHQMNSTKHGKLAQAAPIACFLLAALLVIMALFLPQQWYHHLTGGKYRALLLDGSALLKLCFAIDAGLLIALAMRLSRPPQAMRNEPGSNLRVEEPGDLSIAQTAWGLALVTLLAVVLRLWSLNSGLWLDEISPITFYRNSSLLELFSVYYSTNLHLLNTILVKLFVAVFGEHNWVVRLPAFIFGCLTIPAMFWLARFVFSRYWSLVCAFLLAISYHHIFFAQNARGYSGYLLFSLLSTGFLIEFIKGNARSSWFYCVSMACNFASILISGFVFAGQIAAAFLHVLLRCRKREEIVNTAGKLLPCFALAGFFGLQIYALILPQAYAVMKSTYGSQSTGCRLLSVDFIHTLMVGLSNIVPGASLAIVAGAVIIGIVGLALLWRRAELFTSLLVMPNVVLLAFLAAQGLTASPRFFILALPLFVIMVVELIRASLASLPLRLPQRRLIASSAVAVVACSLVPGILNYYRAPKQDYDGAIASLESHLERGDITMVVYYAEEGFDYYARRRGLKLGKDFVRVRSDRDFDSVVSNFGKDHVFIVTTFERALRIDHPELVLRIEKDWRVFRNLRGTIGDGDVRLWAPAAKIAKVRGDRSI